MFPMIPSGIGRCVCVEGSHVFVSLKCCVREYDILQHRGSYPLNDEILQEHLCFSNREAKVADSAQTITRIVNIGLMHMVSEDTPCA